MPDIPHSNGTTNDGYTQEEIDVLTGAGLHLAWEDWDPDMQLAYLKHAADKPGWYREEVKKLLATYRDDDEQWGAIIATYQERFGRPKDIERAVDAYIARTQQADPTRKRAVRITARELLAQHFEPLAYVVEEILPAGCTLLTGKSKDGKSLMAYDLAVAVASGGKALGRYNVTQGSVWYLALEDGHRRAQSRVKLMQERSETSLPADAQDKLAFTLWDVPRLGEGLEDDILDWISTTPDARLLIVDILEKVRPLRKANGNHYAQDYEPTAALTQIAQERNIAILVIHHANKLNPEDFRDSASGCMSLIGGADNFWSLRRLPMSEEATLSIIGRDIEHEQELAMQFKDGDWTALGESRMVLLSKERQALVDALRDSGRPLTPTKIAQEVGKNVNTIKILLRKMRESGVVIQPTEGHYALSPTYLSQTINPINPINPVNPVNPVNPSVEEKEKQRDRENDAAGPSVGGSPVYGATEFIETTGFTGFTPVSENPPPIDPRGTPWQCVHCHGTTCWTNAGAEPVCSRCHPQAGVTGVIEGKFTVSYN
jgi:hypothetical protein